MIPDAARGRAIYTIGHSTHSIDTFISLLTKHHIDAVVDVRSVPYSRWQPQFNRGSLRSALQEHGIAYGFLGKELGARSDDRRCYADGRVSYRLLAETALFKSGIDRLQRGARRNVVALMCAERNPVECHRAILIGRELDERGIDVVHIRSDGQAEPHDVTMKGLAADLGLSEQDLFSTPTEVRARAYAMQERRIAHTIKGRDRRSREVQL